MRTDPMEISIFDTTGNALSVAVVGEFAHIAAAFGLEVVDVGNPALPVADLTRENGHQVKGDPCSVQSQQD